ncbi:MAG TPA: hypothetical protein VKV17_00445 [Bryobacteraceae bacterium]|nr:hypothetical protein [Bryobacteraceae bacterium]
MKKLLPLMLGTAIAFGTVSVAFSQDQPKQENGKKKKSKKKKTDDTQKAH